MQAGCQPCEAEGEEGGTVRMARSPQRVSDRGRMEHELTHTPFRSWCPFCVQPGGRHQGHYAKSQEDDDIVPKLFTLRASRRGQARGQRPEASQRRKYKCVVIAYVVFDLSACGWISFVVCVVFDFLGFKLCRG